MTDVTCKICPMISGVDYHHEIPQAYGGVDGPQSPLCSGHHTLVHNLALVLYRTRRESELEIPHDVHPSHKNELLRLVRMIVIARDRYEAAKKQGKAPRQGSALKLSGDDMDRLDALKKVLGGGQANAASVAILQLYNRTFKK